MPRRDDDWRRRQRGNDPFSIMGRIADHMDRWFLTRPPGGEPAWVPELETFQRGDQFVVRVDLPGLKKDEVTVDINDEALTIHGERRDEHEETRDGVFTTERSYGSFYRTVPLPEGAIAETAKAGFVNGVLEVTVDAPPRATARDRRVAISS
jgi:HSP20 family protein